MADPPTTSLAWECRVGAIARIEQPPPTQGFMSDHELKRKIRQAMGPRPVPCPKDVGRTRLLEVACQLNLVSSEDAARSALRRGGRPLSWSKRVELAAPSSQPSIEGSGFVTDSLGSLPSKRTSAEESAHRRSWGDQRCSSRL